MTIDFNEERNRSEQLAQRVRAILGVPEELLEDEVIYSPTFCIKANKYINKQIKEYEDLDETLITIAYIYYICHLLCFGMSARVPKQMENVNTKTVLLTIDWDSKAMEMLNLCNDALEEAISDVEEIEYGATFAVLSDTSEYPNANI